MIRMIACFSLLIACTFNVAKAAQDAPAAVKVFDTLTMKIPAGWKKAAARSRIIEHEFSITKGEGEDATKARITMMAAGGDITANIKRWENQFSGGEEAKVEKETVAGQTVHMVQLDGTFKETMGGGPFSGGKTVMREDYAMLGAIIEMEDGRKYFIKVTGPRSIIKTQVDPFKTMLKEMK